MTSLNIEELKYLEKEISDLDLYFKEQEILAKEIEKSHRKTGFISYFILAILIGWNASESKEIIWIGLSMVLLLLHIAFMVEEKNNLDVRLKKRSANLTPLLNRKLDLERSK